MIERILTEKRELLKLFLIATILAFAVSTLSSLFTAQTHISQEITVVICLLLILFSTLILLKDINKILNFKESIDAFVFFHPEKNEVISVKNYRFSEQLQRVMRAITTESKSIKSEWVKDPLESPRKAKKQEQLDDQSEACKPSYISIIKVPIDSNPLFECKSVRLLEEATSFVLLEELSLHLSSYFNESSNDSFLREYKREDIPDSLLKNRVLNLLTTPIEHRDIFLDAYPDGKIKEDGEIHTIWGSNGTIYSRFDLVLPDQSVIKHADHKVVRIETKRLNLELAVDFNGCSGVVSRSFCTNYVNCAHEDISVRKVTITFSGSIKASTLFRSSGWQYYKWLDSFKNRLSASFDFLEFQKDIHWDLIEPLLYSLRQKRSKNPEPTGSKQNPDKTSL